MRELPGDVFVAGQLLPEHLTRLAEQGVQAFINNRPPGEHPAQPQTAALREAAAASGAEFADIPMTTRLTPELIARSEAAFAELPRPIVAFCASGTRSAALWAFAHAGRLGVDGVMDALSQAGFPLDAIRPQIEAHLKRSMSGDG